MSLKKIKIKEETGKMKKKLVTAQNVQMSAYIPQFGFLLEVSHIAQYNLKAAIHEPLDTETRVNIS